MVAEAKWVLRNTKADPLKVAKAFKITEKECWEYLADLAEALRIAEKAYDATGVQKELREWISTIPGIKDVRVANLKEKLQDAKQNPDKHDVPRLLWEVKSLMGKAEEINIQRAKEYPIHQLLNTQGRKGNISCPFHPDKKPSFEIKKTNKFNCYSCGEYGDVIDLYRKLHNVSLQEAVKALGG